MVNEEVLIPFDLITQEIERIEKDLNQAEKTLLKSVINELFTDFRKCANLKAHNKNGYEFTICQTYQDFKYCVLTALKDIALCW